MKKVFLLLTMFLFAFTGVTRADELTVHDGTTTNNYVPVYGFYADAYLKAEFVYPATELADMNGADINGLTFYASQSSVSWGAASYTVFVTEVADATISSYVGDGTIVYNGSLSIVDGEMVVTFTTPYTYNGGNLLVGVYQVITGDYVESTWYGEQVTGASVQGYSYSSLTDITAGQKNFLPKTTFDYTPAAPTPGGIVEVTIGNGTGTTYYFPMDNYFNYSVTEQIYTAEEIGTAGTINTISFYYNYGVAYSAANVTMYMKNVERSEFASTADCEPLSEDDIVWYGTIAPTEEGWYTFTLDTPFEYDGTNNLLVAFYDGTSGYPGTSYTWRQTGTQNYMGLRYYSDSTNPNPYDLSSYTGSKTWYQYRLNAKLEITTGGGEPKDFVTIPAELNLGYRPNNAWMAPYVFTLKSKVGPVQVNAMDFSGNYFDFTAELPAQVSASNGLDVTVTTGTAPEGEVNSTITILYTPNSNRDASQIDITATAYDPIEGDVVETAIEVPAMNVQEVYNDSILTQGYYKNYDLPEETDAPDAVFQVTFNEDVILYAGVEDQNGQMFIYNEDFNGKPGPMADNNYVYEGPEVAPAPISGWMYYDNGTFYSNIGAGGELYWGINFPAADIELLENCVVKKVKVFCGGIEDTEDTESYVLIYEGGEMVYYQAFAFDGSEDWIDVTLTTPVVIDNTKDLMIACYNYGINYPAAGCSKQYGYGNNTDLISFNGSSWTNASNYGIYRTWMLRAFVQTGDGTRTMELTDFNRGTSTGYISAVDAEPIVTNTADRKLNNNRGNRDAQTLINEGFEGGVMPTGWTNGETSTSAGWTIGTGVGSSYSPIQEAANGTYNARFSPGGADGYGRIIMPAMNLSNATSATLSFNFVNPAWAGGICSTTVAYRTNANDTWTTLATYNSVQAAWAAKEIALELPAGDLSTYEISFYVTGYNNDYGYGVGIDDVLVTANISGGGDEPSGDEPWEPNFTAQIDGMFVPAGTYYIVAAGEPGSAINMAIDNVPAPEAAIVIAPEDGEQDVETINEPYVASWIFSDYTEEYQVILDTKYEPEEVLIDWTDELQAGMFLENLLPNQSYYMQVNVRNASGITYGDIIAFTTPIDPVEGFHAVENNLYPGDAAVFEWEANSRTLIGYNLYLYVGGEKIRVNDEVITETTYTVEDLEYNMEGYDFRLTAVYGAGESQPTEAELVYMTGYATISGHVYDAPDGYDPEEPDQTHPIAGARVICAGTDEYGAPQMLETVTDEEGAYTCQILAGSVMPFATLEGYQPAIYPTPVVVAYEEVVEGIDIYTHEFYYPLQQIKVTDQETNMFVEWAWEPPYTFVDFETGDFSQYEFQNTSAYPWIITTDNVYEGQYSIISSNAGVASSESVISTTYTFEEAGGISFAADCMGEGTSTFWDKCIFQIDGTDMFTYGANNPGWNVYNFAVAAGTHTFTWKYTKDSSVNPTGDYMAIDNILMYEGDVDAAPTRSLIGFNLYRRNNIVDAEPVLLAELATDVYEYHDAAWAELPYGEYQWGIQAKYAGYKDAEPNRDEILFTDDFEDGALTNWTTVDADGDDETWENATPAAYDIGDAHSGTNCASSWSWNGYSMYPDNWMISPMVEGATSIEYYVATNTAYPDHYGVYASSTGTNTSDFTLLFDETPGSKGGNGGAKASKTNGGSRDMSTWAERNIELPAGTKYVAFRHWNSDDMNYLFIDDVTIYGSDAPEPPTPGDGLSQILWSKVIDKNMISNVTFNVALNNGQEPVGAEVELTAIDFEEEFVMDATGTHTMELRKGEYIVEVELDGYLPIDDVITIDADEEIISYVLIEKIDPVENFEVSETGWAHWDGATPGPGPQPGPTPSDEVTVILTAGDVWGDGSGYQMLLDDTHSLYGTVIPTSGALSTNCSGNEGIYNQFSHKIPTNADGNCSTQNIVINNSVSITIPAGTYDWCVTNPTPGDRIWIAAQQGNAGGRYDDYVFEGGKTYEFTVSMQGNNDAVNVVISGGSKLNQPCMVIANSECRVADEAVISANRAPMSYKVMLDNEYVGETTYPFMQLPVEGIEEGSTHIVAVAPLYATGMGDWMYAEWVYNPCDHYTGATTFEATVEDNDVTMTWTLPGVEPGPGPTPPTPGGDATIILTAGDVWGDGSGYQMLLDDTHSLYGTVIPTSGALSTNCSGNEGIYNQFSHKIPTNADGNCSTQNIVINNSVSITIPAGTYDWCVTNPTPGDRIWIAAQQGNAGGRYDDYVFEGGKTYEFTVSMQGNNDAVNVVISGGSKLNQPCMVIANSECRVAERSISAVLGTTAYANVIYGMNWSEGYGSFDIDNPGSFSVLSSANVDRGGEYYDGFFYGYSSSNVFYKINYETGAVVEQHSASLIMTEMAYNYANNTMYGINTSNQALYTIDLTTGAATQVASLGSSIMAFGIDLQGNAYGIEYQTGALKGIDLATGAYTAIGNTGVGCAYIQCGGFDHNTETFYWFQILDGSTCALYSVNLETAAVTMLLNTPGEVAGFFVPYEPAPVPTGNIIGVMIWRDDELLTPTPVNNIYTFVDEAVAPGTYEYALRVVYEDWTMACEQIQVVEVEAPYCEPVSNLTGVQTVHPTYGDCIYVTWEGNADSYKVYEGTELLGQVTGTAVVLYDIPTGDYTIGVVAVYADCESDMAQVTVHFVDAVEEVEVVTAIYPNPTDGDLHVKAVAMKHISIYNAMGQKVYDEEVSGNEATLDMSKYEAGVYMVKVTTETGSSVKRVNVMK